jgi:hypothetical protein
MPDIDELRMKSMAKTCYYAHSLHLYNTPQEQRDIELLEALGFKVENPNQKKHQEAYMALPEDSRMDYFVDLVRTCDVCAFRAYPNGEIPSGVYKEVMAADQDEMPMPVFELPWGLMRRGIKDVEHTREWLRELGER